MKSICEICKLPFKDEQLIDLRIDQYMALHDEPKLFVDINWVCVCETCYVKYSRIEKEFDNYPPSLLKSRFPSIKVVKTNPFNANPYNNFELDWIKVIFDCKRTDWNKMKYEFGEK